MPGSVPRWLPRRTPSVLDAPATLPRSWPKKPGNEPFGGPLAKARS